MMKVILTDSQTASLEIAIASQVKFWEGQVELFKTDPNPPAGLLRLWREQVDSWKKVQLEFDRAVERAEEIE